MTIDSPQLHRKIRGTRKPVFEALENRQLLAADFSEMFVFGDSLSDTGNANIATGGTANPAPYYEGRASNGPVAVEYAAQRLGLPNPEASLANGTNYAFSGATTRGPSLSGAPSIEDEIALFVAQRGSFVGDELIYVQGGANDAFAQIFTGGTIGNDPATAASNLGDHVETLAGLGGQFFVLTNLGNIASTPLFVDDFPALAPTIESWVTQYNALLEVEVAALEAELGLNVVLVDQATTFNGIIAQPQKHGFKNVTDPACPACGLATPPNAGDTIVDQPHKYLFWDGVHMTDSGNKILGKDLALSIKRATRGVGQQTGSLMLPPFLVAQSMGVNILAAGELEHDKIISSLLVYTSMPQSVDGYASLVRMSKSWPLTPAQSYDSLARLANANDYGWDHDYSLESDEQLINDFEYSLLSL